MDKEHVAALIGSLGELKVEGIQARYENASFPSLKLITFPLTNDTLYRPALFSDHGTKVDCINEASLQPPGFPDERCKSFSPCHELSEKSGRLVRSASPYIKAPAKASPRSPSNPPTRYKRSQSPPPLARGQTSPRKATPLQNGHRVSFSPPPVKDLVGVSVSHVESPSELYVQEKEAEKKLEHLQDSINKHCRQHFRALTESELRAGWKGGGRHCG